MTETDVQIVLYEGFDELDAVGPFEVFANAARYGADLTVSLVTLEPRETVTASHGLRVGVDGVLDDPDLLVVPGGGWNDRSSAGAWSEVERGDLPEAAARAHEEGATVASVCTGGMILAHGGVLDGRPAVTHHGALDDLREFDVEVREDRVVDDDDVVTAGGVTSGIDLALHLVERLVDRETAERIATEMEFEIRNDRRV
ncbi:DJ-1/PfpI family protein [Halomarina litorea]|uniref:DJ-1/PfpI family protein n=1 Tax=Halomarina litorea TaxID=2961595 RepID=UPI0020C30395|nr:DJ-1/PfpI family protein [Halomarina sp. BCD28]